MKVFEFYVGQSIWNKAIAKRIGLVNAIVFGELMDIGRACGFQSFSVPQAQICNDIGLSEYQLRNSLQELCDFGIISIERKGHEYSNFYKIEPDVLDRFNEGEAKTLKVKVEEDKPTVETKIEDAAPLPETQPAQHIEEQYNEPLQPKHVEKPAAIDTKTNYAKIVYEEWCKYGLPAPKSGFISFLQRDFAQGLYNLHTQHIHSNDVIAAIRNYGEVYKLAQVGETWRTSFSTFDKFTKRIQDFLPDYFDIGKYRTAPRGNKNTGITSEFSEEAKNIYLPLLYNASSRTDIDTSNCPF